MGVPRFCIDGSCGLANYAKGELMFYKDHVEATRLLTARVERTEAALLEIALRTSDAISNEVDEDSFLSACCECNVIATRAMEGTNEFPKDV